jgi:hypothetical protein
VKAAERARAGEARRPEAAVVRAVAAVVSGGRRREHAEWTEAEVRRMRTCVRKASEGGKRVEGVARGVRGR